MASNVLFTLIIIALGKWGSGLPTCI